jgi:hypothetical protein
MRGKSYFLDNFKPPSIDSTKPGTVEIKKGRDKEKSQVAVELSSQVFCILRFLQLLAYICWIRRRRAKPIYMLVMKRRPKSGIACWFMMTRPE